MRTTHEQGCTSRLAIEAMGHFLVASSAKNPPTSAMWRIRCGPAADGAHLTRTFHQMFGIPPSVLMRGEFFEIASPVAPPA